MRVIFMGTPAFAVPSLERVLRDGHEVAAVVTRPDRPAGRGQALTASPVKVAAARAHLPVLQPASLRDPHAQAALSELAPDAILVVAFGQILPPAVLAVGRHGCWNVHASLLPRYRGAAPVAWALIRGERVTGVSIIRMTERVDAGPVLLQRTEAIRDEDTAGTLGERLSRLGAEALAEALVALEKGEARPVPQDEALASVAPKLSAADQRLDWGEAAEALRNRIRGLTPEPGALTALAGETLKVLAAAVEEGEAGAAPGTLLAVTRQGPVVATGRGRLCLLTVQPEGRRPMDGAAFARGRRLAAGALFG
ncbi:MAG: methionyl-tRNA formyltransferase [candidate division NC10 bacterium]|nr:methionyl-tRNA formyltransferase [candidate division NC10 bacterium]